MNVEKVDGRPARHSGDRPALQSVRFLEVFWNKFQFFYGFACGAHGIGAGSTIHDTGNRLLTPLWVGAGGSLGPVLIMRKVALDSADSAQINPAYYQEHMRDVIHFRVEAQAVAWAGYKAPIKGSHEGL